MKSFLLCRIYKIPIWPAAGQHCLVIILDVSIKTGQPCATQVFLLIRGDFLYFPDYKARLFISRIHNIHNNLVEKKHAQGAAQYKRQTFPVIHCDVNAYYRRKYLACLLCIAAAA